MKLGAYEVVEELGRGGMGAVYKARAPGSRREVAVKVLTRGRRATPQQRRRFDREARALATVRHPNVVRLLDVGEHEGAPFLVLEFHPEGSLQDVLDREGPLTPELATRVGLQLASALEASHAVGALHRDLKPDNVLFTARLNALITDFGLAKHLRREEQQELTQKGMMIGTPGYWAPEQAAGRETGPPTDIYGLGATLYAALTGHPPFTADSMLELAIATVEHPPVPIRELRPEVPPALESIVMRCLEKEPTERWPSASELRQSLRDQAFSSEVRPVGGPSPAPRRRTRSSLLVTLVALALFAVALAISAAGRGGLGEPESGVARSIRAAVARPIPEGVADPVPEGSRLLLGRAAAQERAAEARVSVYVKRTRTAAASWCDERAQALVKAQKLSEATAVLRRAVTLEPSVPRWVRLVHTLLKARNYPGAEAAATEALLLDPAHPIRHLRAWARMWQGAHASAEQDLRECVRRWPSNVHHRDWLGRTLREQGKLQEAITVQTETLRLAPAYWRSLLERAKCLRQLGRPREAREDLERALEITPDLETRVERAWVLLELDRPRQARVEFSGLVKEAKAAQDKQQQASAQLGEAKALLRIGEYAAAEASFGRCIRMGQAGRSGARLGRARARAKQGKWRSVLQDVSVVLESEPPSPEALRLRRQARAELGRRSEARRSRE